MTDEKKIKIVKRGKNTKQLNEKSEATLTAIAFHYEHVHDRKWGKNIYAYVRGLYIDFVWLQCFPEIERIVRPYFSRRFAPRWKNSVGNLGKLTFYIKDKLDSRYWKHYSSPEPNYVPFVKWDVFNNLMRLLVLQGEGAYVALEMLHCGAGGDRNTTVGRATIVMTVHS